MVQVIVALVVVIVAVGVGLVLRRRQVVEVPTQPRYDVPAQLDRAGAQAADGHGVADTGRRHDDWRLRRLV